MGPPPPSIYFFFGPRTALGPIWQPAICSCSSEYSRGTTIQPLRKTKLKHFSPISAPWPFPGPSWGGIDGEWKMSATDLIFTPIGCQRSELCSNLCSGDRFWPFYNFQFFGGREFIFPSVIPIRSRRKTKLSCFHRSRRLGLFQGPRGGESTGNGK